MVKKASRFGRGFDDAEAISKGVYDTYTTEALRYSQNAPLTMYKEVNTPLQSFLLRSILKQ